MVFSALFLPSGHRFLVGSLDPDFAIVLGRAYLFSFFRVRAVECQSVNQKFVSYYFSKVNLLSIDDRKT